MRNIIRYTAVLTAGMIFFGGCTFEERLTLPFEEGVPTNVVLSYEVAGEVPMTRAEQAPEYENAVDNLYVFVFDASGNRVWTTVNADSDTRLAFFSRTQQEGAGSIGGYNAGDGTDENLTTGTVTFSVPSVKDATIVGIANLTATGTGTAFSVTKNDMDEINSLAELESYVMSMPNQSVERNALFMMTGYAVKDSENEDSGNTSIDIVGSEGGITKLDCSIQLTRVDAKVVVNVTSSKGDDTWSNFSFEPKTWRVMRVPAQTYLLPYDKANDKTEAGPWEDASGSHWDYSGDDAVYFDTQEMPFEKMTDKEEDNTQYYTGGSFIFYMPENRKHFREEISEEIIMDDAYAYALREERDHQTPVENPKPGQEFVNGDFTYADPNSTYLLLTGYLSYTMDDGTVVNTDARYIVHLGYSSGNPNDYDTKRNGKYTYNITVTGADDLIVEVTNDGEQERRPGYEGDVVYSGNEIFEFDSHYDCRLIHIHENDINDNLTWSVKTAFTSGYVHTPGNSTDGIDYEWIKFAINRRYGDNVDHVVAFPGENPQHYDKSWTADQIDGKVRPLMNIDQLISYLKYKKNENKIDEIISADGNIYISAFVDENLTIVNPETGATELELWKRMVDREDRMMHIVVPDDELTGGEYYSPDGNTSLVTSLYSFIQRSIRTVYNAEESTLMRAWGLESVMETDRLQAGDVSAAARNSNYNSNGRANSLTWMVGLRWEDVIESYEDYTLKSPYDKAAYACLLRNRDLNGNGTVDEDEVRWYLAAIDQLTDIFLGEWALDEASRLYPYDPVNGDYPPSNTVYWHYTSSSPDPAQNNAPNVLWAEEGASRGNYGASGDANGQYYAYRCIRNLGIPLNNPDMEPQDLVQVKDNEDGTYTLDLSYMNPKSLRSSMDGGQPLPLDNEKGANNRPYAKFEVSKNIYGFQPPYEEVVVPINGRVPREPWITRPNYTASTEDEAGYDWIHESYWQSYQGINPCPTGYRIPNQRELLIMATRLTAEQWPVYSVEATYYTGHYERVQTGEDWFGRPTYDYEWVTEQHTKKFDNLRPQSYRDSGNSRWLAYYMCQTSFSMDGKNGFSDDRDGFIWVYETGVFMLQNSTNEVGYVRCVKDTN